MADQIEELNAKIRELEEALEAEKKRKGPIREKIEAMSSEVVDSNPYRWDDKKKTHCTKTPRSTMERIGWTIDQKMWVFFIFTYQRSGSIA